MFAAEIRMRRIYLFLPIILPGTSMPEGRTTDLQGKNAIKWTRLSCRKFRNIEVRLQLHALAYNLGNFMRTLALPKAA